MRSMTLTPSGLLQVARLGGTEVVVEDDHVGLVGLDQRLEFLDLARADVGGDVDLVPLLEHATDHVKPGGLGQAPDLVQGVVGIEVAVGQEDTDQDDPLTAISRPGALQFGQGGLDPRRWEKMGGIGNRHFRAEL